MDLNRLHNDIHEGALQLIAEHRVQLLARAKALCGNDDEAEELVIRTIDQAIRKINTYAGEGDVLSWMMAILTHLHGHDHRNSVVRGTVAVDDATMEEYAGADWTTDEQILKNSDCEAVRAALRNLPPEYRQTVILRFYEDLSLREIARILNKPVGTVGRRIYVALHLLAGKLRAEFGKAKKPLAVLLAVLLGVGALFGAWKAGLLDSLLPQGEEVSQRGEAESSPLQKETESFPLQEETVPPQEESQPEIKKEQTMNLKTVKTLAATAVVAANAAVLPQMAAAVVGASALGATANVIYVAPNGTGAGTSWEDATDLATAFTTATAAGGGEIWLKEGWYVTTAVYAPCSDLTVRGGFVGDETTADAADPKAHPTVLSGENGSSYGWTVNGTMPKKTDANYAPIWTDGKFNVARADDVIATYRVPYLSTDVGLTQVIVSSAAVTGLKLVGLTFTLVRYGPAIQMPAESELEIDSCRFLACGVASGGVCNGALKSAGTVTVRNSEFIGCGSPLYLTGADTTKMNRIIGCRFEDNTGAASSNVGGAITITAAQPAELSGCTFLRNTGVSQANGNIYCPSAVVTDCSANGKLTISDCRFEGNRVRSTGNMPYASVSSAATTLIERCLFTENNVLVRSTNAGLTGHAACIYQSGKMVTVRDTVFSGNYCDVETAESREDLWASAAVLSSCCAQFYNCSFYGNQSKVSASAEGAEAKHYCATVAMSLPGYREGNMARGAAFVNCLFADNELDGNLVRTGELNVGKSGDSSYYTLSLINSAVWNSRTDYPAIFSPNDNFPVLISHSDIFGYTGTPSTNGNNYVEYATAVDPTVAAKPVKARGTYPFRGMLGLSSSSAFAKCGVPIYENEGVLYFYAPGMVSGKPWRKCVLKSTNVAELEAGDPLPDAFGADRAEGAICYGPALTDPPGLMLRVQ